MKRGRYVDQKTKRVVSKEDLVKLFQNNLLEGAYVTPIHRTTEHKDRLFQITHVGEEFTEITGVKHPFQQRMFVPTEYVNSLYELA